MKKKLLAVLLLSGILSAVLTGCGGGSEEAPPATDPTPARAETNEITVGIAQDLDDSLDPHITVPASRWLDTGGVKMIRP